jgi:hypothetical protein
LSRKRIRNPETQAPSTKQIEIQKSKGKNQNDKSKIKIFSRREGIPSFTIETANNIKAQNINAQNV